MLKKILVPLDASLDTNQGEELALEIATTRAKGNKEPARLLGICIVDTDYLPTGRFASLVPRDKILAEAQEKAEQIVEFFRGEMKKAKYPMDLLQTKIVVGSPFKEIIHNSVFCDLIVMGRRCSFPPLEHDYETLVHLYHRSSRPVVIAGEAPHNVSRVVMAMDGTAPASRMMYAYATLNPFPGATVKLVYSEQEREAYHLGDFFQQVADFLTSYGIKVETSGIEGPLSGHLPDLVKKEHADLLAMGIHAEQFLDKFRETLRLGDFPLQQVIQDSSAALFTVH